MRYLILFNRKFPYKTGEAFLENEIDEISTVFDKIIIFPSDICLNDKVTRKINSSNVEVKVVEKISLKFRNIKYLFGGAKWGILNEKNKNLTNKLYGGYFENAAKNQAKKIIRVLEKYNFSVNDEIILYSYWLFITAKVAIIVKEYFEKIGINVRVVSRAHRFDIYEEKREHRFLPQREVLFKNIDKILPCSLDGTEYLKSKYFKYSDKFETAYLGTYDNGIAKINETNTFNIISCSRLTEVKRVELIIDALKYFEGKPINIEWTHIGGGELFERIQERVKNELGFMNVKLLGTLMNVEVYEYYKNNPQDIFINVSSSEGLPVSIMEAISFGIPIIATDVGGTSEIVIENVTGYLLEENFTIDKLIKVLEEVIFMNKTDYLKLRKSTRNLWENRYQATKNYKEFVEIITR